MAISSSLLSLLLALLLTTTVLRPTSAADTHPPSPPPSSPTPPPPPPPSSPAAIQETHLNNIIDALIGAGDFAGWANLLSTADPSSLPLTATFFIPGNDAVSNLSSSASASISFNPFLIPYHIIPQRLTFSDLTRFVKRTRLPTLLPNKYVVVTDASPATFSVDGSRITAADVFVNAAFAVHGVEKVLDCAAYGDGTIPPPTPPPSPENDASPARPTHGHPSWRGPVFPGEITVGFRSDASSCLWSNLMIVSISLCCFVFKIV